MSTAGVGQRAGQNHGVARSTRFRRTGAVCLIAGGVIEAAALTTGTRISVPSTTVLGASLLAAYAVGWVCVGAGFITVGGSFTGRARAALRVAGVLGVLGPLVDLAQGATGSPLGPGPSLLAHLAYAVAIVIAAALLARDSALHGPERWFMLVPAACFVLSGVSNYLPPFLPFEALFVLPWLGTAAAGVILLRASTRPAGPAAHSNRD